MKRRQARENTFIALFEISFGASAKEVIEFSRTEDSEFRIDEFGEDLLNMYQLHADEVDKAIESKLTGWNVDRLPKVNLAVLRLAVTEMKFGEPDMDSIAINEAVELTKKYGSPDDYQFVNGVLGSLAREEGASIGTETVLVSEEVEIIAAEVPTEQEEEL